MHKANSNNSDGSTAKGRLGVVQWVVPPANSHSRGQASNRQRMNLNGYQRMRSSGNESLDSEIARDNRISENGIGELRSNHNIETNSEEIVIVDSLTCRTICTFVEEHLRELEERQRSINRARIVLCNNNGVNNLNYQDYPENAYIGLNDSLKLRIRDEQTKANETIKQLNNYLKELSYLKQQYETLTSSTNNFIKRPSDEEIMNKLSDLRASIIQALNDFVLANGDIDVPIIDSDDINNYDLCIDAMQSDSFHHDQILSKFSGSLNSHGNSNNHGSPTGALLEKSHREQEQLDKQTNATGSTYLKRAYDTHQNNSLDDSCTSTTQQAQVLSLNKSANCHPKLQHLEKRRRELIKLERDTLELRRLFSDFYDLVKIQGEQVETINENIVIATHRMSEGQHNLNKSMRSLTIIMPVTSCMAGAIIGGPLGLVIGGKLGGVTIGCASSLLALMSSFIAQRCMTANTLKVD